MVSPYALDAPGGVQRQVVDLVDRLRRMGEDAYAVAPGAGEGDDRTDVGGWIGVRINRSRAPLALAPRVPGRTAAALAGADLVHVHEPFVPLVGWTALRARKPTVVTFHADPSSMVKAGYRLLGFPLRRVLRGAVATAVSRTAARPLDPLGVEPELIPNAIDVDAFRMDIDRNPCQVAFLGRPDPRKGRDLLLAAWPAVRAAVPDAELVMMGGGEAPPLDGVRYPGRVTELEKRTELASSSVFCAPNRGGESFGITLVEGMAAGCAIVASDLDAFSDVLGGTGLRFRNGDRNGLAGVLARILTDADLCRRMASEAKARVRLFDWDNVIDRYVSLYRAAADR